MAQSRIDRLLQRQAEDLVRLEDREAAAMLRAFEDARRDLRERLELLGTSGAAEVQRFTAQHVRVTLAQVEAAVRQLEERMNRHLADGERTQHARALGNLLAVIKANEDEFRDTGGRLETAALRRLTEERGLLLHEHSVRRYGAQLVETIQREVARSVAAGSTLDQVVARIVGADASVFSGMRGRAELIARMELSRAYNAGHQASLEEATDLLDGPDEADPLLKKADAFADVRNHPFSRALDGKTTPVRGEWEVPDAEVQFWAARLGTRATGIVWRRDGAVWKGSNYPAHFRDRGRQVPWRASWEGSAGVSASGSASANLRRGQHLSLADPPTAPPSDWPSSWPWPPPLELGQQRKHIAGTNEWTTATKGGVEPRSLLTVPAEALLPFVGRGDPVPTDAVRGTPNYRERLRFEQVIGHHFVIASGASAPTTSVVARFRANGAVHFVPSEPER